MLFSLVGCDGGSEISVPEGMQIVKQSKKDGYVFFGPAAWIVANQGDIGATYLSGINTTSMTFVKVNIPAGNIKDYFNRTKEEFIYDVEVLTNAERTNFGNADEAWKYVYAYKYGDYDISCLQVILRHKTSYYVFTYTSYGSISDEGSYYRLYLDRAQTAIDNFLFTDAAQDDTVNTEYSRDADGYLLVSDKDRSGFDLYLPESVEILDNSAIVSAKISENSVISLTRATETGLNILTYLSNRHDALSAMTSDFKDVKVTVTVNYNAESELFKNWSIDCMPEVDATLKFGDLDQKTTASYEYTFTYNGTSYHVFQVLGVGNRNGYVFTYTATEAEYESGLDEVMTILDKVRFN